MRTKPLWRTLLLTLLSLFSLSTVVLAESLDNYAIMTEAYPPFNFEEKGELKGIAVDLMDLVLQKTQSKQTRKDIQLLPWAQGYKRVQEENNTLLFCMTRSAARENLFKWVGPVAPTKVVLLGKKSKHIKINNTGDLVKYKIGVIRDDIGEQMVVQAGVPLDSLDRSAKADANIKKLEMDRIDLWAYEETVARWFIKNAGLNSEDFDTVHVLTAGDLYFAFHKNTPDVLIKQLQGALDEVKSSPTHKQILDRY